MLNLSNIKRIGFIENFSRNGSYPEFGSKIEPVEVEAPKIEFPTVSKKVLAVVPKWKRKQIKALKSAKKAFKSRVGIGYKPSLLTTNKLV